ncbi:hypothetical protein RhiirA5_438909 [Rhizophagus irregularis]|uniref:Uncharacterized protein n=1 Tax=Rhizophagus irregularis TaxID=588596 RepID=A0A2N0NII9_9GLOM|nr:hypothetical protein RhiirA5_438909 [Rhizophagus irregularis]
MAEFSENSFQPSLKVEYDGGIIWTTSSKLLLDVDFDMDLILVQTLKPYAKPDECTLEYICWEIFVWILMLHWTTI